MSIYEEVQHVEVPRTYHYQPKKHYGTMEMGYIYPVYKKLLLPNDLIKINWNAIFRMIQMRVPSYSGIKIKFKAFSLAVRVLDKNFYRFMTGYKEYSTQTKYEEPLATWKEDDAEKTMAGTLWDYLQYQINTTTAEDEETAPLDFYRQLYGYIWDLYFRNETIQESILVDGEPNSWQGKDLLRINWERDYFTTALPFQQLGDPVGIPIIGNTQATWTGANENNNYKNQVEVRYDTQDVTGSIANYGGNEDPVMSIRSQMNGLGNRKVTWHSVEAVNNLNKYTMSMELQDRLNQNVISFDNLSSVTVSMLRQAFALQMYAEMQARGGIRDVEFLLQNFGTAPDDETLQRPKYLGGMTMNILNSEVLQTSQNTEESYLGEIGGSGLGVGESGEINHHSKEYELLMIVCYARPDTMYAQGFKREDTIKINTEFGLPVLGHISEQPIYQRELCACSTTAIYRDKNGNETAIKRTGVTDEQVKEENSKIIGFRPVYDWFREDKNQISGAFHMYQVTTSNTATEEDANQAYTYQNYDWTEARFFDTRPGKLPKINKEFLACAPDLRNNFVVESQGQFTKCSTHNLLFAMNFDVKLWRPISQFGTPGRLDHIV